MKKNILSFVIALFGYCSYAQNVFPIPSGNVGIGINPSTTLDVNGTIRSVNDVNPTSGTGLELHYYPSTTPYGEIYTYDRTNLAYKDLVLGTNGNQLFLKSNGNVGVGTTSPKSIFQLGRPASSNSGEKTYTGLADTDEGLLIDYYYDTNNSNLRNIDFVALGAANTSAGGSQIRFFTTPRVGGSVSPLSRMVIDKDGNIGMGIDIPDAKLAVKGTIHTQEVKVDMVGWGDDVFDKDYPLKSLSSVKNYIDQNHHLPEIPSEADVIKNGVNVGEMLKLQTKKIEELTLYLIDKDKQLAEQNAKLAELQKQNDKLSEQQKKSDAQEARMNALEKALLKLTETHSK